MMSSSYQPRGSFSNRGSISRAPLGNEESLPGWSEITYLCEKPELAIAEVKQCNHLMGRVHNIASVTIQSINSMVSALTTLLAEERKNNRVEEPLSFVAILDLLEEFIAQSSSLSTNIEQQMLPLTANWVSLQTSMVSYDAALTTHADKSKRHDIVIDQQRKKCTDLFQQMDMRFASSSFPSLLQRRRSTLGSKLTRIDRAYRACLEYEFRLSAARTDQRLWQYAEVPGILTALQEMYERRLQSVDKACVTITEALAPYTRGFRVQLPPPAKFGKKFLAECIQASRQMEETLSATTKFTYDLRLTLSDLIERRRLCLLSEQGSAGTPAQSTLSEMVLQQYSEYPTLDMPVVFHRLMEGINQIDPNINLAGAFRTTPRLSELDSFREYLQSDKWTSQVTDEMVNLYAYQLKCWLRELPYPIIPAELYIRCIELGRGPIGKNENVEEQLKEIAETLPEVNIRMLKSLIRLLRRCIKSNPDSGETLITIFAPCLMRNPIDNDPSRMLSDLAAERQFLSSLITYWTLEDDKRTTS